MLEFNMPRLKKISLGFKSFSTEHSPWHDEVVAPANLVAEIFFLLFQGQLALIPICGFAKIGGP